MSTNELKRRVYQILMDYPEIALTPAEHGCNWDVEVPSLGLIFEDEISLYAWDIIFLRVLACKGAVDSAREAEKTEQQEE